MALFRRLLYLRPQINVHVLQAPALCAGACPLSAGLCYYEIMRHKEGDRWQPKFRVKKLLNF